MGWSYSWADMYPWYILHFSSFTKCVFCDNQKIKWTMNKLEQSWTILILVTQSKEYYIQVRTVIINLSLLRDWNSTGRLCVVRHGVTTDLMPNPPFDLQAWTRALWRRGLLTVDQKSLRASIYVKDMHFSVVDPGWRRRRRRPGPPCPNVSVRPQWF